MGKKKSNRERRQPAYSSRVNASMFPAIIKGKRVGFRHQPPVGNATGSYITETVRISSDLGRKVSGRRCGVKSNYTVKNRPSVGSYMRKEGLLRRWKDMAYDFISRCGVGSIRIFRIGRIMEAVLKQANPYGGPAQPNGNYVAGLVDKNINRCRQAIGPVGME